MKKRIVVTLVILVLGALMLPTTALAADRHQIANKKWRSEVRRMLKLHKVYNKTRERQILNIIAHESTGNSRARSGSCVGLLQFNKGWAKKTYSKAYFKKHKIKGRWTRDPRLNPSWSIHRIVEVYKKGGDKAVRRHWAATINR